MAITNHAAMKTHVQIFRKKGKKYFMYKFMKILALVLVFLGFVPSSEIAGSHGNSTFNIGGNANCSKVAKLL